MPVLIDRSRMEAYETCPRLRLLTYHYGGRGIVPVLTGYELMFGRIYHEALEALVKSDALTDAQIIMEKSRELARWIRSIPNVPTAFYATEQLFLFEGLLWAWVRVKRPEMLRDYEILSTEQEFLWNMGTIQLSNGESDDLIDMVRLDVLLKDRTTDSIYYKEYKTSSYGDSRWAQNYEHNAQVMANLAAVEEALNIRPAGILLEAHIKGPRRVDTSKSSQVSGLQIQDSPLCYVYARGSEYSFKYAWKSVRVPVWDTGFTPRAWVQDFMTEDDVRELFVQLPPISPDPYHVDRWRRQKLAQEERIHLGLRVLADSNDADDKRDVMDRIFPLYEQSCIRYGRKCSHYEICHDRAIAEDPLSTGNYIERIPHHDAELALVDPVETGANGAPNQGPA